MKITTPRIASIALCIALAALIAPQPVHAQTAPYEIDAIRPLTGSAVFLGQAFLQALKLVEQQANATGGIHGRSVRFVLQIVAFEHFAPTDLRVAAQMAKIKDRHPGVLMAWGTGTPNATEYHAIMAGGLLRCANCA